MKYCYGQTTYLYPIYQHFMIPGWANYIFIQNLPPFYDTRVDISKNLPTFYDTRVGISKANCSFLKKERMGLELLSRHGRTGVAYFFSKI